MIEVIAVAEAEVGVIVNNPVRIFAKTVLLRNAGGGSFCLLVCNTSQLTSTAFVPRASTELSRMSSGRGGARSKSYCGDAQYQASAATKKTPSEASMFSEVLLWCDQFFFKAFLLEKWKRPTFCLQNGKSLQGLPVVPQPYFVELIYG